MWLNLSVHFFLHYFFLGHNYIWVLILSWVLLVALLKCLVCMPGFPQCGMLSLFPPSLSSWIFRAVPFSGPALRSLMFGIWPLCCQIFQVLHLIINFKYFTIHDEVSFFIFFDWVICPLLLWQLPPFILPISFSIPLSYHFPLLFLEGRGRFVLHF